jgi:hypothetical protein
MSRLTWGSRPDFGLCLDNKCCEEVYLLGTTLFSPLKVNRRFGGTCSLHRQGRKISHARNQLETGSNQWTTWPYIPEDITLRNQRCENLKSCIITVLSLCDICLTTEPAPKHSTINIKLWLVYSTNREDWRYLVSFSLCGNPSYRAINDRQRLVCFTHFCYSRHLEISTILSEFPISHCRPDYTLPAITLPARLKYDSYKHHRTLQQMSYTLPFALATKLHGLSPQANYTDRLSDRRLLAKSVPNLADRGCRVVSATVPPQSLISAF